MNINGEQFKCIQEALLHAYSDEPQLALMVRIKLNKKLNAIAEGKNHSIRISNLIEWAEGSGKLQDLIFGAYEHNKENPRLIELVSRWPKWQQESSSAPNERKLDTNRTLLKVDKDNKGENKNRSKGFRDNPDWSSSITYQEKKDKLK